jgi:hypothetical protein
VVLFATEFILFVFFAMSVAAPNTSGKRSPVSSIQYDPDHCLTGEEVTCLVLHIVANFVLWGHAAYVWLRGGRNPSLIYINAALVLITALAFSLFVAHIAINKTHVVSSGPDGSEAEAPGPDLAGLGSAAAYAVLMLSFLVAMLCTF